MCNGYSTKNKKYYILYKVVRDSKNNIIDIEYIREYTKQADIIDYIKCSKRDIQAMLNNSFNNNLRTFKELTIIKEC